MRRTPKLEILMIFSLMTILLSLLMQIVLFNEIPNQKSDTSRLRIEGELEEKKEEEYK